MSDDDTMQRMFDHVDSIIVELAHGDESKRVLLDEFFFRVLCVLDAVEGDSLDWKGIALVSSDALPDNVKEINDDFLHDEWSNRRD